MTEELQNKMDEVCRDLIANNASAIAKELQENPEGKLSVSLGVKLKLVGSRIYFEGSLSYSRKFTDAVDAMCEFNDPRQPKLEGLESVTISTGESSVTIDGTTNFKRATDKVVQAMDKVFAEK